MLKKELGIRDGIFVVHCPIGLNLGGTSPKEIATSVASALLKVNYGK
jgi:xanthine dehydrogenase accessory factor